MFDHTLYDKARCHSHRRHSRAKCGFSSSSLSFSSSSAFAAAAACFTASCCDFGVCLRGHLDTAAHPQVRKKYAADRAFPVLYDKIKPEVDVFKIGKEMANVII